MSWDNYKFKIGTTVYNWYFDLETEEIMFGEYQVDRYEYSDSMQWEVIDQYICGKDIMVPHFRFFKKKERIQHRIPGHLLHTNKDIAKVIFLKEVLQSFSYVLNSNKKKLDHRLYNRINNAKMEYNKYIEESPEIIIQAQVDRLTTETNSGNFWR